MKVGLVSPYNLALPGGVQAQVFGLARELDRLGDEAVVIGPGLPDGVEGVDLGPTINIHANGSVAPISLDPRQFSRVPSAARELDVIHVHEPLMPFVSWASLRSEVPIVGTFHADPRALTRTVYSWGRGVLARLLERMRAVTAVSKTAGAILPETVSVEIIPNGVDCAGISREVPRFPEQVAFLGRDEPRKGLDVLLEAWDTVVETKPEARLVVMGAQREKEGVRWLGHVADDLKGEILSSSAVYVAPNLGGESFGIVVVEGMAAGAAVVASDLDAFREVGGDGAVYVPPGDPAALAAAIVQLLGDEDRRSSLAERGKERAARYDWSQVVGQYRALYERAAS